MPDLRAIVVIEENDITTVVNPSTIVEGNVVVGPESATDGNMAVFDGTTGALLRDGGAPGGGGSFLSANTARVDPSGDDGTGTVGDLSKPFETVQGALDALATANGPCSVLLLSAISPDVPPPDLTIDISAFVAGTAEYSHLFIIGVGNMDASSLNTVTVIKSEDTTGKTYKELITFINLSVDSLVGVADEDGTGSVIVNLQNANVYEVIAGGHVNIQSYYNNGLVGSVIGAKDIYLRGVSPMLDVLGFSIDGDDMNTAYVGIVDARPAYDHWSFTLSSIWNVDAAGADIFVVNSILGDITCASGTMIDSRATGTITAGTPLVYNDVLLKGVPPGGTTGQALEKASNDDFDTSWESLV